MMYVIGAMYAVLIGVVGGWFFYNVCVGPKKDRLRAGVIWGVGIAIIATLAAFGG
jgi:ABC-type uncharacterized transport system permease subunit